MRLPDSYIASSVWPSNFTCISCNHSLMKLWLLTINSSDSSSAFGDSDFQIAKVTRSYWIEKHALLTIDLAFWDYHFCTFYFSNVWNIQNLLGFPDFACQRTFEMVFEWVALFFYYVFMLVSGSLSFKSPSKVSNLSWQIYI